MKQHKYSHLKLAMKTNAYKIEYNFRKKYSCLMRISFPAIERIVKMTTKFKIAAKNHVTPHNSWFETLNLNLGPKKPKWTPNSTWPPKIM